MLFTVCSGAESSIGDRSVEGQLSDPSKFRGRYLSGFVVPRLWG